MVIEPSFRYIDRAEICRLRGISKTKQYEDERSGYFPAGERHGYHTLRWRSDVVAKWLDAESKRLAESSADTLARQVKASKNGVEANRKKRAATAIELAGQA